MDNDSSWVPDGAGCAGMGRLLLRKGGVQRDTEAALAWLEDGCALLDSDSCADVAYHGLPSGTVTVDVALLRALTACFERSGYGCWVAGWLYQQTGSEGRGNAQQYQRQACDLAYAPGCTALAGMLGGDRVADAFKHLRRACVLGDGEGCAAYGSLLASQDVPGEAYYRAVGCEMGHAPTCWELMHAAADAGLEVEAGELRSRACRLDPAYCKRIS
jgi:TPR repeat protein